MILYTIYNGLGVYDKLANDRDRELIPLEKKPSFPIGGIYHLLISLCNEKYDCRSEKIRIKDDPNTSQEAKKLAEVKELESQMGCIELRKKKFKLESFIKRFTNKHFVEKLYKAKEYSLKKYI